MSDTYIADKLTKGAEAMAAFRDAIGKALASAIVATKSFKDLHRAFLKRHSRFYKHRRTRSMKGK